MTAIPFDPRSRPARTLLRTRRHRQHPPNTRLEPVLGRLFTRQDDSPKAPKTVILSHSYWQRKFGGDRTGVGRAITIEAIPAKLSPSFPDPFGPVNLAHWNVNGFALKERV